MYIKFFISLQFLPPAVRWLVSLENSSIHYLKLMKKSSEKEFSQTGFLLLTITFIRAARERGEPSYNSLLISCIKNIDKFVGQLL